MLPNKIKYIFAKQKNDPLSIISVGFLVVSTLIGTVYVASKNTNFDIRNLAITNEAECVVASDCGTGYACNRGICVKKPTATPTKSPTNTPTKTPTSTPTNTPKPAADCKKLAERCSNGSECCSGKCDRGYCVNSANITASPTSTPVSNITNSPTTTPAGTGGSNITVKKNNGEKCDNNYACKSGYCTDDGICKATAVTTPTPIPQPSIATEKDRIGWSPTTEDIANGPSYYAEKNCCGGFKSGFYCGNDCKYKLIDNPDTKAAYNKMLQQTADILSTYSDEDLVKYAADKNIKKCSDTDGSSCKEEAIKLAEKDMLENVGTVFVSEEDKNRVAQNVSTTRQINSSVYSYVDPSISDEELASKSCEGLLSQYVNECMNNFKREDVLKVVVDNLAPNKDPQLVIDFYNSVLADNTRAKNLAEIYLNVDKTDRQAIDLYCRSINSIPSEIADCKKYAKREDLLENMDESVKQAYVDTYKTNKEGVSLILQAAKDYVVPLLGASEEIPASCITARDVEACAEARRTTDEKTVNGIIASVLNIFKDQGFYEKNPELMASLEDDITQEIKLNINQIKLGIDYLDPTISDSELRNKVCQGADDYLCGLLWKNRDSAIDLFSPDMQAELKNTYQKNFSSPAFVTEAISNYNQGVTAEIPRSVVNQVLEFNKDAENAFYVYRTNFAKEHPRQYANMTDDDLAQSFYTTVYSNPTELQTYIDTYKASPSTYAPYAREFGTTYQAELNAGVVGYINKMIDSSPVSGLTDSSGNLLNINSISPDMKQKLEDIAEKEAINECAKKYGIGTCNAQTAYGYPPAGIDINKEISSNPDYYLALLLEKERGSSRLSVSSSNLATIDNLAIDEKLRTEAINKAKQMLLDPTRTDLDLYSGPNLFGIRNAVVGEEQILKDQSLMTQVQKTTESYQGIYQGYTFTGTKTVLDENDERTQAIIEGLANKILESQLVDETYTRGAGLSGTLAAAGLGAGAGGAACTSFAPGAGTLVCGIAGGIAGGISGALANFVPIWGTATSEQIQKEKAYLVNNKLFQGNDIAAGLLQGLYSNQGAASVNPTTGALQVGRSASSRNNQYALLDTILNPATNLLFEDTIQIAAPVLDKWDERQQIEQRQAWENVAISGVTGGLFGGVGGKVANAVSTSVKSIALGQGVEAISQSAIGFGINLAQNSTQIAQNQGNIGLLSTQAQIELQSCKNKGKDCTQLESQVKEETETMFLNSMIQATVMDTVLNTQQAIIGYRKTSKAISDAQYKNSKGIPLSNDEVRLLTTIGIKTDASDIPSATNIVWDKQNQFWIEYGENSVKKVENQIDSEKIYWDTSVNRWRNKSDGQFVSADVAAAEQINQMKTKTVEVAQVDQKPPTDGGTTGKPQDTEVRKNIFQNIAELFTRKTLEPTENTIKINPENLKKLEILAEKNAGRTITETSQNGRTTTRNLSFFEGSDAPLRIIEQDKTQIVDGQEVVVMKKNPDGTETPVKRSRIELTDIGKNLGLDENFASFLNENLGNFEDYISKRNPNIEHIRIEEGSYRNQAEYMISFLESLGNRSTKGLIVGAQPGVGKTDIIIPLSVLLNAKLTGNSQFVVFPDLTILKQFTGEGEKGLAEFYENELGEGSVLVITDNNPPPVQAIKKAKIIITTKEIAFQLQNSKTASGREMISKWSQSYIQADEGHWTLNPFENYRLSEGATSITKHPNYNKLKRATDAVRKLNSIKNLIKEAIAQKGVDGTFKTQDGRGMYTDAKEAQILSEWLSSKKDVLPDELKTLISEGEIRPENLNQARVTINKYLDTNFDSNNVAATMREELAVINKLSDVVTGVVGNEFAAELRNNVENVVPREQGKATGRSYGGLLDQYLYNTVGAEILGTKIDIDKVTLSKTVSDITFTKLLLKSKGYAMYTGTPEPLSYLFKEVYGVTTKQVGGSAYEATISRFEQSGSQGESALTFSFERQTALRSNENRNSVYINLDKLTSNANTQAVVFPLHEGKPAFIIDANGKISEGVIEGGIFKDSGRVITDRDALNEITIDLDNKGQRYVKFYEYGAHTGVDTFNDVALSRGVIICRSCDETTFTQGTNRLRPNKDGSYPPFDVIELDANGDITLGDFKNTLRANEATNTQISKVLFQETLMRTAVDIMFDDLIAAANQRTVFGIDSPDNNLIAKINAIQESWKSSQDMQYRLGSNDLTPEQKLNQTLEQIKGLYKSIDSALPKSGETRATFQKLADGYTDLLIGFKSGDTAVETTSLSASPSLAEVINLINNSSSDLIGSSVRFTEKGASPQVIENAAQKAIADTTTPDTQTTKTTTIGQTFSNLFKRQEIKPVKMVTNNGLPNIPAGINPDTGKFDLPTLRDNLAGIGIRAQINAFRAAVRNQKTLDVNNELRELADNIVLQLRATGNIPEEQIEEFTNQSNKMIEEKLAEIEKIYDKELGKPTESESISVKVELPKETEKVLVNLDPRLPEKFKIQARRAAEIITALDNGTADMNDPEVKTFLKALNNDSGSAIFTYFNYHKGAFFSTSSDLMPNWLIQADDNFKEESIAENLENINNSYNTLLKDLGLTTAEDVSDMHKDQKYTILRPENRHDTLFYSKIYIEKYQLEKLLDSKVLTRIIKYLQQSNPSILPYDFKINDGSSMVFYFNTPELAAKFGDLIKSEGYNYRGPVQDVMTFELYDNELYGNSFSTNDARNKVRIRTKYSDLINRYGNGKYSTSAFIQAYINGCIAEGRNPLNNSLISFGYLNPGDSSISDVSSQYNFDFVNLEDSGNNQIPADLPVEYTPPAQVSDKKSTTPQLPELADNSVSAIRNAATTVSENLSKTLSNAIRVAGTSFSRLGGKSLQIFLALGTVALTITLGGFALVKFLASNALRTVGSVKLPRPKLTTPRAQLKPIRTINKTLFRKIFVAFLAVSILGGLIWNTVRNATVNLDTNYVPNKPVVVEQLPKVNQQLEEQLPNVEQKESNETTQRKQEVPSIYISSRLQISPSEIRSKFEDAAVTILSIENEYNDLVDTNPGYLREVPPSVFFNQKLTGTNYEYLLGQSKFQDALRFADEESRQVANVEFSCMVTANFLSATGLAENQGILPYDFSVGTARGFVSEDVDKNPVKDSKDVYFVPNRGYYIDYDIEPQDVKQGVQFIVYGYVNGLQQTHIFTILNNRNGTIAVADSNRNQQPDGTVIEDGTGGIIIFNSFEDFVKYYGGKGNLATVTPYDPTRNTASVETRYDPTFTTSQYNPSEKINSSSDFSLSTDSQNFMASLSNYGEKDVISNIPNLVFESQSGKKLTVKITGKAYRHDIQTVHDSVLKMLPFTDYFGSQTVEFYRVSAGKMNDGYYAEAGTNIINGELRLRVSYNYQYRTTSHLLTESSKIPEESFTLGTVDEASFIHELTHLLKLQAKDGQFPLSDLLTHYQSIFVTGKVIIDGKEYSYDPRTTLGEIAPTKYSQSYVKGDPVLAAGEDMSDAFALYTTAPEWLRTNRPVRYAFVDFVANGGNPKDFNPFTVNAMGVLTINTDIINAKLQSGIITRTIDLIVDGKPVPVEFPAVAMIEGDNSLPCSDCSLLTRLINTELPGITQQVGDLVAENKLYEARELISRFENKFDHFIKNQVVEDGIAAQIQILRLMVNQNSREQSFAQILLIQAIQSAKKDLEINNSVDIQNYIAALNSQKYVIERLDTEKSNILNNIAVITRNTGNWIEKSLTYINLIKEFDIPETNPNWKADRITKDPNILKVITPNNNEVIAKSGRPNLPNRYSEIDQEYLSSLFDTFEMYSLLPTIGDSFINHSDRSNWQKQTYEKAKVELGEEKALELFRFLKDTKLSRVKIGNVVNAFELIENEFPELISQESKDIYDYLKANYLSDTATNVFDTTPLSEKRLVVEKVEGLIKAVYEKVVNDNYLPYSEEVTEDTNLNDTSKQSVSTIQDIIPQFRIEELEKKYGKRNLDKLFPKINKIISMYFTSEDTNTDFYDYLFQNTPNINQLKDKVNKLEKITSYMKKNPIKDINNYGKLALQVAVLDEKQAKIFIDKTVSKVAAKNPDASDYAHEVLTEFFEKNGSNYVFYTLIDNESKYQESINNLLLFGYADQIKKETIGDVIKNCLFANLLNDFQKTGIIDFSSVQIAGDMILNYISLVKLLNNNSYGTDYSVSAANRIALGKVSFNMNMMEPGKFSSMQPYSRIVDFLIEEGLEDLDLVDTFSGIKMNADAAHYNEIIDYLIEVRNVFPLESKYYPEIVYQKENGTINDSQTLLKAFADYPQQLKSAFEELGIFVSYSQKLGKTSVDRLIDRANSLERIKPGITKFLNDKFGIRMVHRYYVQTLIDIYDNYASDVTSGKPYGLIVSARADHNGAFESTDSQIHDEVATNLRNNGYIPIFIETSGKQEYVNRFLRISKEMGASRKASFMLIYAHGTAGTFRLGNNKDTATDDTVVRIKDLSSTGTDKIKNYYETGLPFGFISCSTGVECGIAQNFSKTFGSFAIGPDEPTNIKSIVPQYDTAGKISGFSIQYTKQNIDKIYRGGVPESVIKLQSNQLTYSSQPQFDEITELLTDNTISTNSYDNMQAALANFEFEDEIPETETGSKQLEKIISNIAESYNPNGCSNCSLLVHSLFNYLTAFKNSKTASEKIESISSANRMLLDHVLDNQVIYASGKVAIEKEVFRTFGVNRDELIESVKLAKDEVGKALEETGLDDNVTDSLSKLNNHLLQIEQIFSDNYSSPAEKSDQNKLIHYLTGIWPDTGQDYLIVNRMVEDHYRIKAKYGLPPRQERIENPSEYLRKLQNIAKENGIPIRSGVEFQSFFDTYQNAGAVYMDEEKVIVVPLKDFGEEKELDKYLGLLEHELIHALQHKKYPDLPIELREYEAYIGANTSLSYLTKNPLDSFDIVLRWQLYGSVDFWYKDQNLLPVWKSNEIPKEQIPTNEKPSYEVQIDWFDNLKEVWKSYIKSSDEKKANRLIERVLDEKLQPNEKTWNFIFTKGGEYTASGLAYGIGNGSIQPNDEMWQFIFTKGGESEANRLAEGIVEGRLQPNDEMWQFIFAKGDKFTAICLAEGIRYRNLQPNDEMWEFIFAKGDEDTADLLAEGIRDGKIQPN